MRLCDALAEWFERKGYVHAFGIIGGGNVAVFDAIARRAKTQIVCVHHEQAAAMAAGYYWRQVGRIAPVLCTTGAGSANAITGVLAAWMDSVPLLVISGNEASHYMSQPQRVWGVQGYASCEVSYRFVKYGARMMEPDIDMLDHAVQMALSGRPGPVWIDIPKDIQNAMV